MTANSMFENIDIYFFSEIIRCRNDDSASQKILSKSLASIVDTLLVLEC
jgi:hypothetical protein